MKRLALQFRCLQYSIDWGIRPAAATSNTLSGANRTAQDRVRATRRTTSKEASEAKKNLRAAINRKTNLLVAELCRVGLAREQSRVGYARQSSRN